MTESMKRLPIVLGQKDLEIVQDMMHQRGLGAKNRSAAIRVIIREWAEAQETKKPNAWRAEWQS